MENHIFIEDEGKGICKRTMFKRVTTYDAAIVRSMAQYTREFGNNGFSKERTHRAIGEIPLPVFLEMQQRAAERGEEVTGSDLRQWLKDNPGFMSVRQMKTHGGNPNIIIK